MGIKGVSNAFNWTFSWFPIFSMCELPHLWATKMMLKINSFVRLLFICLLTIDSSPWGHRNVFWFYHRAREYRRPNLVVVTGTVFEPCMIGCSYSSLQWCRYYRRFLDFIKYGTWVLSEVSRSLTTYLSETYT